MLISMNEIRKYYINAKDSELGLVKDILFEENSLKISHILVDADISLPGRMFILPPNSIGIPERLNRVYPIPYTKKQLQRSPIIDFDNIITKKVLFSINNYFLSLKPLIKRKFSALLNIYNMNLHSDEFFSDKINKLRSFRELIGSYVDDYNEIFGSIDDIIIDDLFWEIRFFVITVGAWYQNHRYLFPKNVIGNINWKNNIEFKILVSKNEVYKSPKYNQMNLIRTDFTNNVYKYYGNLEKNISAPYNDQAIIV